MVHLSSKSRHRKANLEEAPFGPVLNGAFIAQSSSRTQSESAPPEQAHATGAFPRAAASRSAPAAFPKATRAVRLSAADCQSVARIFFAGIMGGERAR